MDDAVSAVERAARDLAAGQPVVVVDDSDRENEGDLIFAAELATPELLAFVVRHTSGYVCVPMRSADLDRLNLPEMVQRNEDPNGTAYAVAVDAATGVGTGISARDRARTIRLLADPAARSHDFVRPGHVLPLRARPGGVLERRGHTEAGVDLMDVAGLRPVAGICEIVGPDGNPATGDVLAGFVRDHELTMVSIAQLVAYRCRRETLVEGGPFVPLATRYGSFQSRVYTDSITGTEHLALVHGELGDGEDVLVRIHSECFTGDLLGSSRCDCGQQFAEAAYAVVREGRGVLVYLRGQEGRGIGLDAKMRAYHLQDQGADTVDANLALGLPVDARDYRAAAHILRDLGVSDVRLLTNNPDKVDAVRQAGLLVRPAPLICPAGPANVRYLRTKRDRLGHLLPGLSPPVPAGQQRPSGESAIRIS